MNDDTRLDMYDMRRPQIPTPPRNETFEGVAAEIIDKLDMGNTFDRSEVELIAEWVKYLSTQD